MTDDAEVARAYADTLDRLAGRDGGHVQIASSYAADIASLLRRLAAAAPQEIVIVGLAPSAYTVTRERGRIVIAPVDPGPPP
jgi:hypothetical protein